MGSKCLLCSNLLEFQNVLCGRHCYHYYLYFIDGETEARTIIQLEQTTEFITVRS